MTETEDLELIPGRVLRTRFRRMAVAQILLIVSVVFAFWLLQQSDEEAHRQRETLTRQQEQLEAEQQARTRGLCESTVTGRATQLMFSDVLVSASTTNGDVTDVQQRRIDAFTAGVDERLLGELPQTCRGIMALPEFQERVRAEARPPPEPGALP